MSIDPVSANRQQQFQQVRDDFSSLSQALSNGNLTAAQKAYASIQQDQQNGPQPPANSPIASAFNQLGQALQSGDLAGAQQAFANIQSQFQNKRAGRGGHHGGGGAAPSDDGSDSSDPSSVLSSSDSSDKTVSSEVTTTNADGTLTVTTTYSDGTTSTSQEPNPTPTVSKNPLDGSNSGQLSVLLNAQETATQQSQQTAS